MSKIHPIVSYGPGIHVGDYMLATSVDNKPLAIEGHKLEKIQRNGKFVVAGAGLDACACGVLAIDWLPFCSEKYHISSKIDDYVIVEVPIVVETYPNRNLDAFPYEELTAWSTQAGRPRFQTFVGKPVHQDHKNQDDTKAKGVIFDASLRQYQGRWHVVILKGFDRSKDPRLAELVQKKNRIGHSMGSLVQRTECSLPWCRYIGDGITTCEHIRKGSGKGDVVRGHLVYELLRDFDYVESSSVEDPAYCVALSDSVWQP
ncbi:MAG: hypothetical protein WC505_06705 [Patescibacteria group bacterium]